MFPKPTVKLNGVTLENRGAGYIATVPIRCPICKVVQWEPSNIYLLTNPDLLTKGGDDILYNYALIVKGKHDYLWIRNCKEHDARACVEVYKCCPI
jgi:hypothetical protein